ncbi:MAG: ParB/RepB/Spo0J family partition protein [Microthrixaceae bacterium]|nr:ParB/RepB/Spo0J family partition protein [Microthrixaceae bacterium]
MSRKGGLGRGLTSLIPPGPQPGGDELQDSAGDGLLEVSVDLVVPNPNQPRRHFDEESLDELAASMAELGVLQPLLVKQVEGGYELIAGERRLRAAKRAGLLRVPVVVRSAEGALSLEEALVENLHRRDLNPMEEAAAYQRLVEEFGYTQERVAERVGRSRSAVANLLRLFQLTPGVQKLVGEGLLSAGHAKVLLSHPDRAYQEALAKRAVRENLTVRQLEDLIRERERLEGGIPDQPSEPGDEAPNGADEGGDNGGRPKLRQPGLIELEQLLADHLDTRVAISMSAKRGKVTIEFADLEDLERIYRRMIPGT